MISDRQLRPRRHLKTQSETSQRGDDERKSRSLRTFRIESDPILFPQDSRELLADLVRHMHPYCIRTHARASVEEEEEVFVDVEGDEDDQSEQDYITHAHQRRSALVKTTDALRVKKTVSFALDLISVHEIPPDDDDEAISKSKHDITSSHKPKALSLDQYRLLRQKTRPVEETRVDFRTKWPSLPDLPKELPPILTDSSAPKLNPNTASLKVNTSQISRKDAGKVCVDPPNPVLVPLKPTASERLGSDACEVEVKPDASEPVPKPASVTEPQNQTACGEIGELTGINIQPCLKTNSFAL